MIETSLGKRDTDAILAVGRLPGRVLPISLKAARYAHVYRVLVACKGNKTHAAIILDITLKSVRRYVEVLKEAGIDVPQRARGGYVG